MPVKKIPSSMPSSHEKVDTSLDALEKQADKLSNILDKARVKKLTTLEKNLLSGGIQQKRLRAKLEKSKASLIRSKASFVLKATPANQARIAKYQAEVLNLTTELGQYKALRSTHKVELRTLQTTMKYLKAKDKVLSAFEQAWAKKIAKIEKKRLKAEGIKQESTSSLSTDAPKRRGRGRPPKVATTAAVATAPKRRGRPPKVVTTAAVATAPKRRGRPPKAVTTAAVATVPKRRGRPPKAVTTAAVATAPKRRGRPPKAVTTTAVATAPKRRGRPPKAVTTTAVATTPKRRGRPPKATTATAVTTTPDVTKNPDEVNQPVIKSIFDEKEI